ncbi:anti-phage dCTP deaminase [Pseudooceanicola marinus]|uniref:anti-phage dCTP deaminase n=1 Tax=Pseudooceanicola marinus TaxID=396013 RepID=UPI00117B7EEC|nr:anti-phage dCTP deaminase [Pseudooceanicola marinus]
MSQELVFAMVGPVGSGCTTVAEHIKSELQSRYDYSVPEIITVSGIIRESSRLVGVEIPERSDFQAYLKKSQEAGNAIRERFGEEYLIKRVIEKIHKLRDENGGFHEGNVVPKRIAYVIDSIKNIEELKLLRSIYRDTLVVVGVFAPESQRSERLDVPLLDSEAIGVLFEKDMGEKQQFGQATRKVFTKSDLFISNDSDLSSLKRKVRRLTELCFDIGINTPLKSEAAMYKANAIAGNSACLSRQVGAAIVSASGEFIGVGWNDVPRFGGGLYDEDQRQEHGVDNRCYAWGGCKCHNESTRNDIVDKIAGIIASSNYVKSRTKLEDIRASLLGSPVDALIEFSRSIHAEMEAILSVAREGKHSLVGATLYTNTYPCHNCARHIVAAGIKEVVFIEPYLKSMAISLHSDAISEDPANIDGKVLFRQFDGVSPRNYLKFFRSERERKGERGRYLAGDTKNALPRLVIPLDAATRYEEFVIASLVEATQKGD